MVVPQSFRSIINLWILRISVFFYIMLFQSAKYYNAVYPILNGGSAISYHIIKLYPRFPHNRIISFNTHSLLINNYDIINAINDTYLVASRILTNCPIHYDYAYEITTHCPYLYEVF